ncbi:MAG: VOC family protein [Candidatus Dormibacteraeota bacterium]|nr:VOC family protein [Candidatus Dormibacteraeota bacterium]
MITGLGHVAFRITDLPRALDFYCGKLGFREAFRLDRDGEPSPWIVYLQLAPNQFLELFPGGEGEVAPRSRAAGYNHFCLTVDDLEATLQELKSRGVAIEGGPRQGMDTNWQYWITDPDGNAIELMQIMPASPQAEAGQAWASTSTATSTS